MRSRPRPWQPWPASSRLETGSTRSCTVKTKSARLSFLISRSTPPDECPDQARAGQALYRWLTYCADSGIGELIRLAATIDLWRTELLAYFTTGGISNGPIRSNQPTDQKRLSASDARISQF